MHWMARQVRAAKHRADLERRVDEWLDADAVTGNESARDGNDTSYHDGSKAYDRDTGRLKAPTLMNELQKKQVRALLHMTRILDHLDKRCSDDYRGAYHYLMRQNV
jgi:hypothetical protein